MSKRRLDKLEDALGPKEAVLHWMEDAHDYGSLPAYVESRIGQPEATQPFIALPARVEQAVWAAMRGQHSGFAKQVTREAVGDTVFLLRLVIGFNVHFDDVVRVERLRQTALYWWTRVLDAQGVTKDGRALGGRSGWERGVATLRGTLLGTERARTAAESRFLEGHDCRFPELTSAWSDLDAAAESLADPAISADDAAAIEAERSVRRVLLMARADGLEVSDQHAADAMAERVIRLGRTSAFEATDG